ncbi:MAG: N-formylglutamate amidohydrolase [Cyclobacteriaceae bacterium]
MSHRLIITCEHAGNQVPPYWEGLFKEYREVLQSHQGWDPGAWPIAQAISAAAGAPLFGCHTTRLLIEPNRSIDNPQLFSRFSDSLSEEEKTKLINQIYLPYRQQVKTAIDQLAKPVLHLSVHTFTPVWKGTPRTVDIGLLFDPTRNLEADISARMRRKLQMELPDLSIRFNEPYLGIDDGFTTYLRKQFSNERYAGVEIEVKQSLIGLTYPIAASISRALEASR